MLTTDEIKSGLLKVVEGVRNPPAILNFVPLPYTRRRFSGLVDECIALHREVDKLTEDSDTWEHTQRLFAIEAEYKRLRTQLLLIPSIFLVYFGFALILWVFTYANITGFIKEVLRVDAPERLVTFGVAGAFLYLATTLLSTIAASGDQQDAISRVADFTIRILLAIVVPILLVSLFFTSDGKLAEVTISPELLAFACGYSAKLVVEILSKIVEKGSKMLEAI